MLTDLTDKHLVEYLQRMFWLTHRKVVRKLVPLVMFIVQNWLVYAWRCPVEVLRQTGVLQSQCTFYLKLLNVSLKLPILQVAILRIHYKFSYRMHTRVSTELNGRKHFKFVENLIFK